MRSQSNLPPVERLNELLRYDPETGNLYWRVNVSNRKAGSVAGYTRKQDGYVHVRVDGGGYLAHRLIWLMVTGCEPPAYIDHQNHVTSDNRWHNLREASASGNLQNRRPTKGRTLPTGVSLCRCTGRFRAKIMLDRKHICLGRFDTVAEAAAAYAAAKAKLHTFHPEVVS